MNIHPLFLIRYDEIALKGDNRDFFESSLLNNIKDKCQQHGLCFKIEKRRGRIYLNAPLEPTSAILKTTPGIASFSLAFPVEKKLDFTTCHKKVIKALLEYDGINIDNFFFKIESRREDKHFPLESYDICKELGQYILDQFPGAKVQMKNPDFILTIEVRHKIFFVGEKITTCGGLPVGTTGHGLLLLSGGIDSPVAGIQMAIRGLSLSALHFHSYPYTSEEAKDKVKDLVSKLKRYSPSLQLYFFNLAQFQKCIQKSNEVKYITLLVRRAMVFIADQLAKEKNIPCLITGESMGQVASQTLESLTCTDVASTLPIFRPLIGMNKKDIIALAEKHSTYDISIRPYEDCCTLFNPSHPIIHPNLKLVLEIEKKIPGLKEALENCLYRIELVEIDSKI